MALRNAALIRALSLGILIGWRGEVAAQPNAPTANAGGEQTAGEPALSAESGNLGYTAWYRAIDEDEARVRQALDAKISVQFKETPLREALDEIVKQCGVSIRIDWERLTNDGVAEDDFDSAVTLTATGITVADLLNQLLEQAELASMVGYCGPVESTARTSRAGVHGRVLLPTGISSIGAPRPRRSPEDVAL